MTDLHPHDLPEGQEPAPPGAGVMAIVRWALVVLMAAVAVGSVVSWRHGAGATIDAAGDVYYCPMHPSVVQDHPGECPICSMTLVRRDAAHAATAATPSDVPGLVNLELPADRVQRIGVRTAVATRTATAPVVRAVAYVAAAEDRTAKVHPRFAGWIERLDVAQTGATVRRGQVLATIYSPELLTAQQELLNTRRWRRDGGDLHAFTAGLADDARHRLRLLGIAPEEIAQIERSGQPLTAIPLRSPVDGVVVEKTAVRGAYVEPAMPLYGVADLSTVWVHADVYERDLAHVRAGMPGRLTLAAWPGLAWTGRIDFVPPTVDPETRTARIRLVFANDDGKLRPGLYGDVHLDLPRGDAITIPSEALVDTGELQYVFLARDGGRFEPRRVRVGQRRGDAVEVLEGIAEGERVVTTANFLLDSESRLRAAIGGLTPAHQH